MMLCRAIHWNRITAVSSSQQSQERNLASGHRDIAFESLSGGQRSRVEKSRHRKPQIEAPLENAMFLGAATRLRIPLLVRFAVLRRATRGGTSPGTSHRQSTLPVRLGRVGPDSRGRRAFRRTTGALRAFVILSKQIDDGCHFGRGSHRNRDPAGLWQDVMGPRARGGD